MAMKAKLICFNFQTSKFDGTLDDIKIEKILRFLEQYWPHFEFDLR